MNKIKVSVIIPMYNSSKHIERCIDSAMNQTMNKNEYEIICVDDCSKDNTVKIVKNKLEKNDNLILVEREVNSGGASAPRNQAMDIARGEYIYFIDSDDYIGEETLDRLYTYAKQNNSDIVIGKLVGVNGRPVSALPFYKGNVPKADIIENKVFYSLTPHKLFKVSTLKKYNVRFDEDVVSGEDMLFCVDMFTSCKTISIYSKYNCYYLTRHDGIHLSNYNVSAKKFFVIMSDIIEIVINSKRYDAVYKKKLVADLISRYIKHNHNNDFYKSKTLTYEEQIAWLNEYSVFLNKYVTHDISVYMEDVIIERVNAIKSNDLVKVQMAESIYELKVDNDSIKYELINVIEKNKKLTETVDKLIKILSGV